MAMSLPSLTGTAINLSTQVGPNLFDLAHNPFNPYKHALQRPDPIMTYTWYVELPGYDFGANAGGGPLEGILGDAKNLVMGPVGERTGSALEAAGGVSAELLAASATSSIANVTGLDYSYVEEATLPLRQYSARRIFRNGTFHKSPENYTVGDMRLQIYADSEGKSMRYLNAWHNTPMLKANSRNRDVAGGIWRATGKIKRNITAVVLAPNHEKVMYLEYVGCWIMDFSELSLNSAGGERLVYSVNISVDDVFVTISGKNGLIDASAGLGGLPL